MEKYLRDDEAVVVLADMGIETTTGTLAKQRCLGEGPEFFHFGRQVFYTETTLRAYVAKRMSGPKRSTTKKRAEAGDAPQAA